MKKILRIMTPIVVLGLVCTPVIALSATSCKDKTDDATTLRTLLIYMCASDLESDWALATFNIDQMLITDLSASSINIILETGGTTEWTTDEWAPKLYTPDIDTNKLQHYKVVPLSSPKSVEFNKMPAIQYNDLQFLDDVTDQNGQSVANDMTNKQRLIDFIKYGYDNFPSSKVDLDLWDHGGGLSGICWDDHPAVNHYMSFVDVMYAIQTGANYLPGNKFEFVGYDACLMAGYEQAYLLRNSTKYIINSEDSEPGNGWDYSALTSILGNPDATWDSNTDSLNISKVVVDAFMINNYNNAICTLSVIDTSKIDNIMTSFKEWVEIENTAITNEPTQLHNYQAQIQNNNVLCYQANQFYDMGDMIQEVSAGQSSSTYFTTTDAKATAVINNIKAAVVYEQHMSYNAGSTGLSIFCTNPTNVTGNNRGYYNTAYLGVYEAVNLKTNTNWTPYWSLLNNLTTDYTVA